MRPAIFLDRDGTIIADRNYPGDPEQVELLPGAAAAIAALNRAGWPVIVVTNQSGIARGLIGPEQYREVAERMLELLAREGARIDASYYCPHGPDTTPSCSCRKPLPGLFESAAREWDLDLARSIYIGDRVRDLAAGIEAGGRAFLIRGTETSEPDDERITLVESLRHAADAVLRSAHSD